MSTFDINKLCFFDTETRSMDHVDNDSDLKDSGTYAYMKRSFVIILTYAIGMGPVQCVAHDAGFDGDWLCWDDMPEDLREFYEDAQDFPEEHEFVAFNAGFDRQAWNEGTFDFPRMDPEMLIDCMAQVMASNLPPSLEGVSQFIGRMGKHPEGKRLIKLFCLPSGGGTPQTHPEDWALFKQYATEDVEELREGFLATRQLPLQEWREYWASERINERGIMIDRDLCERAAAVAVLDQQRTNKRLSELTGKYVTKVTQHKRIADWLWDHLADDEARQMLIKEFVEDADSEEQEVQIVKVSAKRENMTKIITYLQSWDDLDDEEKRCLEVAQLREFGASSAPAKFQKMLDVADDDALKGQYVFNGAGQTGRFSAKGVQIHNLTRDVLGKDGVDEVVAIEMINDLEV